MSIVNDIVLSMVSKLKAISPDVQAGIRFSEMPGQLTAIRQLFADDGAERAIRVVAQHDDVPLHQFGGTAAMVQETIVVYVGYQAQGNDTALHARISADKQQIRNALLTPNLSWPNTSEGVFADLRADQGGSLLPIDEAGNLNIYQIPLICLYETR